MIELRKLEERKSKIIKQSYKKERHGNQCIMVVNPLTQLRRHMELNLLSLRRKSQERPNLK